MSIYESRYNKFINYYLSIQDDINENYEIHHILPRAEGGQDDPQNLIKLPIRAHYLAHYMLAKIYPSQWSQFILMSNRTPKINSRLYESGKKEYKKYLQSDYYRINVLPKIVKKSSITKQKIIKDGMTQAKIAAIKQAKTMSIPDENGITIRQKATEKQKETWKLMKNTIDPVQGLQLQELVTKKQLKTKRERGSFVKGMKVNTALKIGIFNRNDEIVKICEGNFFHFCKELGLPHHGLLRDTFVNNSVFNYDDKKEFNLMEKAKLKGCCYRKINNKYCFINSQGEIVLYSEKMSGLGKILNFNNAVQQMMTKTFRENSVVEDYQFILENYRKYKKIDGWYARIL